MRLLQFPALATAKVYVYLTALKTRAQIQACHMSVWACMRGDLVALSECEFVLTIADCTDA